MSYPQHILPNKNYKFISNDAIPNDATLLRILDNCSAPICDQDIKDNTHNYTPSKAFLEEDGLSVVLLGEYQPAYCCYKVNGGKYHDCWSMGKNGLLPEDNLVTYVDNKPYVGMSYSKINQYVCPINDINSNISFENSIEDTIVQLHLSVEHNPTYCNYWHCLVHILAEDNQKKEYDLKDYDRRAQEYNKVNKNKKPRGKVFVHKITKEDPQYASLFVLPANIQFRPLNPNIYTLTNCERTIRTVSNIDRHLKKYCKTLFVAKKVLSRKKYKTISKRRNAFYSQNKRNKY